MSSKTDQLEGHPPHLEFLLDYTQTFSCPLSSSELGIGSEVGMGSSGVKSGESIRINGIGTKRNNALEMMPCGKYWKSSPTIPQTSAKATPKYFPQSTPWRHSALDGVWTDFYGDGTFDDSMNGNRWAWAETVQTCSAQPGRCSTLTSIIIIIMYIIVHLHVEHPPTWHVKNTPPFRNSGAEQFCRVASMFQHV